MRRAAIDVHPRIVPQPRVAAAGAAIRREAGISLMTCVVGDARVVRSPAPVVWAPQVLETAAREGFPSRAEVTDAA